MQNSNPSHNDFPHPFIDQAFARVMGRLTANHRPTDPGPSWVSGALLTEDVPAVIALDPRVREVYLEDLNRYVFAEELRHHHGAKNSGEGHDIPKT